MALKKKFLHRKIQDFNISKQRFVIGLIYGVVIAFAIYFALYLSRESLRLLTINEFNNIMVLTDHEVNFYNIFFAYIASIFGQSISFSYWFNRPRKFKGKLNKFRVLIVTDQRVINWNFINWFVKLSTSTVLVLWMSMHAYYVISFYSIFAYLFVLIVIVLFLQTWISLRLAFFGKSFKWMVLSFIVISVFSLGMSRINLLDYKTINKDILSENIEYTYKVKLPQSDIYAIGVDRSLYTNVWIVKPKTRNIDTVPLVFIHNNLIPLDSLHDYLSVWMESVSKYKRKKARPKLYIDADIKMKYINRVLKHIVMSNIYKVNYAVTPTNPEYDATYYRDIVFMHLIGYAYYECADMQIPMPPHFNSLKSFDFDDIDSKLIRLSIDDNNNFSFNDSIIKKADLRSSIKSSIAADSSKYLITFKISQEASFGEYFKVLVSAKGAIDEVRSEYSYSKYGLKYSDLHYDENRYEIKKSIMRKYPFALIELPLPITIGTQP